MPAAAVEASASSRQQAGRKGRVRQGMLCPPRQGATFAGEVSTLSTPFGAGLVNDSSRDERATDAGPPFLRLLPRQGGSPPGRGRGRGALSCRAGPPRAGRQRGGGGPGHAQLRGA